MYYPIFLAHAAGFLESRGFEVDLLDSIARKLSWNQTSALVHEFDPDLIVVESNFSSVDSDAMMAARLSVAEDCPSVVTGPPVVQYKERILHWGTDYAISREYERSLLELASAIENGRSGERVSGVSCIRDQRLLEGPKRAFMEREELDELPFVTESYSKHLRLRDYFLNHSYYPMVQIMSSRGCPQSCTFCSWPSNFMGHRFRTRSTVNIVDELEYVESELPSVREVFFEDDCFTSSNQRVHEVCEEMRRRRLHISWSCQSRANLPFGLMSEMKSSGCRLLDVGFESGSDAILRKVKKGITVEEMRRFAADAKRAKLQLLGDFVIGLPGETHETIEETRNLIRAINPDILQVSIATPIPGTEFCDFCRDSGYIREIDPISTIGPEGLPKCVIEYPNLSGVQIESAVGDIIREYYLNPCYLAKALRRISGSRGFDESALLCKSLIGFLRGMVS